jgi:hypothetical protein
MPPRQHLHIEQSQPMKRWILLCCALSVGALVSSCTEDHCARSDDPCCGVTSCVRAPSDKACAKSPDVHVFSYDRLSFFVGSEAFGEGEFLGALYGPIAALMKTEVFQRWEAPLSLSTTFDQRRRLTAALIDVYDGSIAVNFDVAWEGERVQEVSMSALPSGVLGMTRFPFDAITWNQPLTEHHPLIAPFVARSLRLQDDPVVEVWPHPMLPPLHSPQDISQAPWLGAYIIGDARVVYPATSDADRAADWSLNDPTAYEVRARMRRGDGRESVEMFSVRDDRAPTLEGVAHYTLNPEGAPIGLELQNAQGEVLLWTSSTESATPDADAPPTSTRQVTWVASPSPDAKATQTLRLYLDDQGRLVGVHFASSNPTLMNTTIAQANPFRARIDYSASQRAVLMRDDGLDGSIDSLEVLQTDAEGAPLYGLRFFPSRCEVSAPIGDWSDTNLVKRALSALRRHPCGPGYPNASIDPMNAVPCDRNAYAVTLPPL